jgi:hypothetical protein
MTETAEALTQVELIWIEKQIEHWVRFGRDVGETIIDRRRRVLNFAPGSVFAFIRWSANDYGTVISKLDVLRAVGPGEALSTVPHVRPGGELLLHVAGWPKVERVLQVIDAVEALGLDAAEIAPDYWRYIGNRFAAGEPIRLYTREQHRAWLKRRRATP